MKLNNTIIKPIVTEKAMSLNEKENTYVFEVSLSATKHSVASEVQRIFNVTVTDVRTSVIPGKKHRIGKTRKFTRTTKYKKAVVSLKEGDKLDIYPSN
ncbi:MAG: 50S ribosomal protein L23 [Patescibacteria group bacterium]|uniref:Large ribosomal subunit protein uL23 n=1 Tax=candidate division WWE3 bacterium TaxID=2053526 RepID=A0A955ED39_UNCKA|nr:50S ribosomal protein L23 [candidate division WWE3 bacterium]